MGATSSEEQTAILLALLFLPSISVVEHPYTLKGRLFH